jgi:hypothetical protein
MTDAGTNTPKDRFQAEFEALPLEEKFARLFRMEAATLSEAFTYAFNSSSKVVERMGDVISDFGVKIETEVKRAAEHCKTEPAADAPSEAKKAGARTRKTPPKTANP